MAGLVVTGAGDGGRTRDPQLGKLMLYQLSYTRMRATLALPSRGVNLGARRAPGEQRRQALEILRRSGAQLECR